MNFGVVIIGRNEGERLRRCLDAIALQAPRVVYVDSGSTDASVAVAKAKGAVVVELDRRSPFSAARARNEGFRRLLELAPGVGYVQFVDGDCELAPGWLEAAAGFLERHARVAAACGRLREKHPERSVYNLLCDIEWQAPAGETKACGGIVMMRASAFAAAQGFRADLIAGEEAELCVRLRAAGWRIWRLNDEMALHDAMMSRFGQWWRRALRTGYAFAQGADLHGAPPERHWVVESRRAWLWGLGVPVFALAGAALVGPPALLALALYPLQVVRLALRGKRSTRENWWHALFLVIGKIPEMLGQVKYRAHRQWGTRARLIEYK